MPCWVLVSRATAGVHVIHLGPAPTPPAFFDEAFLGGSWTAGAEGLLLCHPRRDTRDSVSASHVFCIGNLLPRRDETSDPELLFQVLVACAGACVDFHFLVPFCCLVMF